MTSLSSTETVILCCFTDCDARKVPKVGTRNRITSWRRDVTLLQANDDRLSLTNDVMKILHLERSGWDYFTEAVTSHSFKETVVRSG